MSNDFASAVRQVIQQNTDRIKAERVAVEAKADTNFVLSRVLGGEPQKESGRMSNLASIADRIKAKKEAHAAKADAIGKRLDALDAAEPAAFAAMDSHLQAIEDDLSALESEVRALSNGGPLGG